MKISKDLEWIEFYLDGIEKILPEIQLVDNIVGKGSTKRKDWIHPMSAFITQKTNQRYDVTIYISRKRILKAKPFKIINITLSKLDVLEDLAHELAHLRYFDEHTPHHKLLELKIHKFFILKSIKDGYISEEHELGDLYDKKDYLITNLKKDFKQIQKKKSKKVN